MQRSQSATRGASLRSPASFSQTSDDEFFDANSTGWDSDRSEVSIRTEFSTPRRTPRTDRRHTDVTLGLLKRIEELEAALVQSEAQGTSLKSQLDELRAWNEELERQLQEADQQGSLRESIAEPGSARSRPPSLSKRMSVSGALNDMSAGNSPAKLSVEAMADNGTSPRGKSCSASPAVNNNRGSPRDAAAVRVSSISPPPVTFGATLSSAPNHRSVPVPVMANLRSLRAASKGKNRADGFLCAEPEAKAATPFLRFIVGLCQQRPVAGKTAVSEKDNESSEEDEAAIDATLAARHRTILDANTGPSTQPPRSSSPRRGPSPVSLPAVACRGSSAYQSLTQLDGGQPASSLPSTGSPKATSTEQIWHSPTSTAPKPASTSDLPKSAPTESGTSVPSEGISAGSVRRSSQSDGQQRSTMIKPASQPGRQGYLAARPPPAVVTSQSDEGLVEDYESTADEAEDDEDMNVYGFPAPVPPPTPSSSKSQAAESNTRRSPGSSPSPNQSRRTPRASGTNSSGRKYDPNLMASLLSSMAKLQTTQQAGPAGDTPVWSNSVPASDCAG